MVLRFPEEVALQEEELSLPSPQSLEPDWTLISPQGIFPSVWLPLYWEGLVPLKRRRPRAGLASLWRFSAAAWGEEKMAVMLELLKDVEGTE